MPPVVCSQQSVTEFGILAYGSAALTIPECEAIRKEANERFGLSPLLLKHSDEQTLASLVAVYQAIKNAQLKHEDFQDWGIVSCSRFLGRTAFAGVLAKYKSDGPWGVSVQVIPHRTAHGISGTISLALKNHGPCIGVGGGDGGDRSALLALTSVLDEPSCPAAWMVLSGWTPELQISECGVPIAQSMCQAVALAISPTAGACQVGQMRIVCESQDRVAHSSKRDASGGKTSRPRVFDFLTDPLSGNRWCAGWDNALQISIELSESVRWPRTGYGPRVDTAHEGLTGHLSFSNHRAVAARSANIGQDSAFHG